MHVRGPGVQGNDCEQGAAQDVAVFLLVVLAASLMIPMLIITPSKLPLNCHHGVITLCVPLYCMYCTAFITQSNDGSEAVAQQADEMAPDWMLSFGE